MPLIQTVRRHAEKAGNVKAGQRIVWKNKHGEYIGRIRHTYKHRGKELAMVQFDSNKRVSRVPVDEIAAEQNMHWTAGTVAPSEQSVNQGESAGQGESSPAAQ